jgi:hypothetical protein
MATLPSTASLTGASTTNAQQKTNFTDLRTYLSDLLGTDSANKGAARTALGVPGLADFANNLSDSTGYLRLPSGGIMQWGEAVSGTDGAVNVTLPLTMTQNSPHIICNVRSNTFNVYCVNLAAWTKFGFTAYVSSNGVAANTLSFNWLVIGY